MPGGRPPSGPKLVNGMDGSEHAKRRLEVVLRTIAGEITVAEACEQLGVGETAFRKIRAAALDGALKELEPKHVGRPRKVKTPEQEEIAKLQAEPVPADELQKLQERNKWLEEELELSRVREELDVTMPFLAERRRRKAEGKKRRRRERRARTRGGSARRADDAAGDGGDGSRGGSGDSTGGVRADAEREGASEIEDERREETGPA